MSQDPTSDPLTVALQWRQSGHKVALATVVRTWGSSPRPIGSYLVVRDDGHFEGSVSGGCVEGEVIRTGKRVMTNGVGQLLAFGVTDEQAWEVGLACGGEIEVLVEPIE